MIEIFFKLKSENFLYFNVGYRGCRTMLFWRSARTSANRIDLYAQFLRYWQMILQTALASRIKLAFVQSLPFVKNTRQISAPVILLYRMQGSEIQTSGKSGKSMSEMTKFAAFFLIFHKSVLTGVLSPDLKAKVEISRIIDKAWFNGYLRYISILLINHDTLKVKIRFDFNK